MPDTGKGLLKDLFTLAFLILVVVIPIRVFVISPFVVDGESMHPTFENLDYLIVDEAVYDFKAPARGEVIVFRYPKNPSVFYIKRIIGLPGETVSIDHGVVSITDASGKTFSLPEPYIVNEDATYTKKVSLRDGEYFVMGDNRPNSSDSRVWGVLPQKNIIGRVDLRILPIANGGFFPGTATYMNSLTATTTAPATP
ncbi:MAG: signal peptidase I [Candidatus Paceibacteria bacterium]